MSTTYVNTINSNPIFADRATKDASGNDIQSTYAHDSALSSYALSADVSAYRVVSSTSTQLYFGTAYLTGVNGAPISASRAGNAANASMANSAYYDGTGRLISALPDNARVSSIASGYVTGVSATVANNSASWGGGGGSVVSPSGTIFVTNGNEVEGTNSAVLTASGGEGFESTMVSQHEHLGPQMQILTYGTVPGTGATLLMPMQQPAYVNFQLILSGRDTDYNYASASGTIPLGTLTASIPMGGITGDLSASADQWFNLLAGALLTARKDGGIVVTGVGELAWNSALTGVSSTVANHSAAWEQGGVPASTVSSIASSYASSAVSGVEGTVSANSATWNNTGVSEATVSSIASSYADSAASSKQDSSAMSAYALSSDVSGVIDTVSANSASWGQGGVDSATVSSIASSYAESAASSKMDTSAMSSYALSADVSGTIDTVSANSATWGQGFQYGNSGSYSTNTIGIGASGAGTKTDAGIYLTSTHGTGFYKVNELTLNRSGYGETVNFNLGSAGSQVRVSASGTRGGYFSAWNNNTEAALVVSGSKPILKLGAESATDTSISSWNDCYDTVSANSASWGQGGVDSATVSSIASSYAQDVSAAVSGTVDTVSSQSANWGGSALALSAGPGVKLEKVGNTLVASVDGPLYRQETLAGYWNGSAVYQQFISGTATTNGNTNFSIPAEITGTNIVNKWIDPSNSFMYYNTTSNAAPISWCMGSDRYGSVAFVGSVIQYRCVDTSPTTLTAYIAIKYMKA